MYAPNASEEELNKLSKDPEAAAKLSNELILGRTGAHSKIKNTVNDIQEKYEAIKKLEQVSAGTLTVLVRRRIVRLIPRVGRADPGLGRNAGQH